MDPETRARQPPIDEQPGSERDQGPSRLRIALLGQFQVSVDGQAIDDALWQRRRARSLVKLLALAPRQRLHREEVLDTLWPKQDTETASANLRVIVHAARRALQSAVGQRPVVLQHVDNMIVLQPDRPAWVDAIAFEDAAATAQRSGDARDYQTAIDAYTGDLLPEDRYEDWTAGRRERLRDTYLTVLLGLAGALERGDNRSAAIEALERVIAAEPAHEEAAARLMLAYARAGQRHRALRLFQHLRRVLERELDATPEPATQQLYAEILAGDSSRLHFESDPDGPPAGVRHNLRSPLTSFIGREDERAQYQSALESSRLVTLTGTGGCGKTRLALATARTLVGEFQDGVWFIDLAPLVSPEGIPQTVASVLDITFSPATDEAQALVEALRTKQLLLVLDNCEHLVDACAGLTEQLLVSCPRLRILATSREPLRVSGEVVVRVPALRLPPEEGADAQQIAESDAVRLFDERARHLQPDFSLTPATLPVVAAICRRLDGLPLAIELAAGRVPMFSVEELARRLHDPLQLLTAGSRTAQPRQQTLRATLEWSYRLLDPAEQRLLERLSVFAGGCTLEAVEAISAGSAIDRLDVLGLLAQLVDKSLVQVEPGAEQARYRMLETVRQYAAEQRDAGSEGEPLEWRHAGWFLDLAETAERGLLGSEQTRWLERLDGELDNLRAALHTFERSGAVAEQLRLASALVKMWWIRGHPNEGRRWLERGLASVDSDAGIDDAIRAKALQGTGNLARMQGDIDRALAFLEEAVAIQRKRGDEGALADALDYLAQVLGLRGDLPEALAFAGEELELRRQLGDPRGTALCLGTLGELSFAAGDAALSSRYIEEALPLYRAHGDEHSVAITLNNLGEALRGQGLIEEAAARFQESLTMFRALDATHGVAYLLANLGDIARAQGRHDKALLRYLEALPLFRELGYRQAALSVVGALAALDAAQGQAERTARLFGAEEALREEAGFALLPDQRADYDSGIASARERLPETQFEAAWRSGRLLSLDNAVDLAATVTLSDEDRPDQAQARAPRYLSKRERDVALLAARGLTNQQIAETLGISVRTAETHLSNLLRKLGLTSRREIAGWVARQGLLDR